jgi:hypothetical protein
MIGQCRIVPCLDYWFCSSFRRLQVKLYHLAFGGRDLIPSVTQRVRLGPDRLTDPITRRDGNDVVTATLG